MIEEQISIKHPTFLARPTRWPGVVLITLVSALIGGCSGADEERIAVEITERFPALADLRFSLPGNPGVAESGSAAVHAAQEEARAALAPLEVLAGHLDEGGTRQRDRSIVIALEGAPRVLDNVIRYDRSRSRLDVEQVGDHVFFFMQYDRGQGYDPDEAISENMMLVEGATAIPEALGQRAGLSQATGLADPHQGYLRLHFNRRAEDQNGVHSGAQLDYRLGIAGEQEDAPTADSLHLTFFVRSDYQAGDATLGIWQRRQSDGTGFLLVSEQRGQGRQYRLLAQYRTDGALAVWQGDGSLWGCYSGSGNELGNAESPEACAEFDHPFPSPPSGSNIWPSLPGGVPR